MSTAELHLSSPKDIKFVSERYRQQNKKLKWSGGAEECKKRLPNNMVKIKSIDRGAWTASAGTTGLLLPPPIQ